MRSARHRASSAAMTVHALPPPAEGQDTRVAVVAGRSVGPAVRRNRVKRRLRAAARSAPLPPADLVIDGRRAALDVAFTVLCHDVVRLSRRALRGRS